MAVTRGEVPQGSLRGSPWLVLALVCLVVSLTGVGLSIMSVAFPAVAEAFPEASAAELSWVANVFTIIGAATLIPAGVLADRWGRKRMVLVGTALFTAGSLLAGFAPGPMWLVAARGLQALGASAYTPAGAALTIAAFPPDRLGTAVGVWAVAGGLSSAIGPALGGVVIEAAGWEWAFWINVPVGLVVLALGPLVFVESFSDQRRRLPDPLGGVLLVAGVSLVVLAVVESDGWGWTGSRTLGVAVTGLVLLGLLVWRSARVPNPMLDLGLLRVPSVGRANLGTLVIAISWFAVFWALVLVLTNGWGWSVLRAGLVTAPIALFSGLGGVTVGRLADRYGHRVFIVPGAVLFVASALWLWWLIHGGHDSLAVLLPSFVVFGVASGMVFPSFIAASVAEVPPDRHAIGSGLNFTSQRVGTTLGVAFAITFLAGTADPVTGFGRVAVLAVVGGAACLVAGTTVDTRPATLRPADRAEPAQG